MRATLPVTGSTLATMSVSVSEWLRCSDESMPVRRILTRAVSLVGVAMGVALKSSSMPPNDGVAPGPGVAPGHPARQ